MKLPKKMKLSDDFKRTLLATFFGSIASFVFAIFLFSIQQCSVKKIERQSIITKLIAEIDYNLFVAEQKGSLYTALLHPVSKNIDGIPRKIKYSNRQKIIYDNRLFSYKYDMINKSFKNGIIYEFLDSSKAALMFLQIIKLEEYENNLIDYISISDIDKIDNKLVEYFLSEIVSAQTNFQASANMWKKLLKEGYKTN